MAIRRGGSKPRELTGKRVGRLVVAGRGPYTGGHARWFCVCDCGERLITVGSLLLTSHKLSCGCLLRDRIAQKMAASASVDHARARFARFVNVDGPIPANAELGPCSVWTGAHAVSGYGTFSIFKRARPAHRVAWFLATGEWPKLFVLHKCDNGPLGCVRFDHLFEGTHDDNMADMVAKGRSANCGTPGAGRGRAAWRGVKKEARLGS